MAHGSEYFQFRFSSIRIIYLWPVNPLYVNFVHVDGVRSCLSTVATNRPVHPPGYKEHGERCWDDANMGKPKKELS